MSEKGKNPYAVTQGVGEAGHGKKVVVAMSGGVDSSVAAVILKEQGFEVVGIALQTTDYSKYLNDDSGGTCCSTKDMEDARRVAEAIGIPFYVLNTEEAFDASVVDYFVNEYVQGRTPNPCVMCNNKVKFEHLHKKAMDMGADFVATGHYAKLTHEPAMGYCLWKARDLTKDQSYFLFGLTQSKLARTLFPLGNLTKVEARQIASRYKLPVAFKPDSQEICFVPHNNYVKFLTERTANSQRKKGYIIDLKKNTLGEHDGVFQFTIGQRKGLQQYFFREAMQNSAVRVDEYRVIKIDPVHNVVIVGTEADLFSWGLMAAQANWIVAPDLRKARRLQARIRHHTPPVDVEVRMLGDNRVDVRFTEAQRAVTPGQAVVFYDNNLCLGGAWIEQSMTVEAIDRPHASVGGASVLHNT